MLVKYCFWTTGKHRMRSVIHVLLRWITNFFLSSMELCRTVVRKSSIRVLFAQGAWHPKYWQKLPICSACYFNLGGFAHKRPPLGDGNGTLLWNGYVFWWMTNSFPSYRCMAFQGYTRSGAIDGGRVENHSTWQITCKNPLPHRLIFHF